MIDLRSDTVTRPTDEMRAAMAVAEVGDDVYGEDPTVNDLQRRAAAALGKEAALFVPTGTMANQVAIACHTRPGQEVVCEERSHVVLYEMSGMAVVSGVMPRTIRARDRGRITWSDVRETMRSESTTHAGTGLVTVENTHNMAGGTVQTIDKLVELCDGVHEAGVPVHLDGARIFNAAVALGVSAAAVAAPFDSAMFCLSKGLAAPVGSVLVGSATFIARARNVRKLLGGGMRQAGILAAAGIVALERMTNRLEVDHANARALAEGLVGLPGVRIDPREVQTNIVIFDLDELAPDSDDLTTRLQSRGVLADPIAPRRMRMVTHCDVAREDCDAAVAATRDALLE